MLDRDKKVQSAAQSSSARKVHLRERHCPLSSAAVTAELDPWLQVASGGETTLFGYCRRHDTLGGLMWLMSSRVLELDADRRRARTACGRVYALGRCIGAGELPDEEARVVLRFMTEPATWPDDRVPHVDLFWLACLKVARWLDEEAPPRGKFDELWEFLVTTRTAYLAALRAAGVGPRRGG